MSDLEEVCVGGGGGGRGLETACGVFLALSSTLSVQRQIMSVYVYCNRFDCKYLLIFDEHLMRYDDDSSDVCALGLVYVKVHNFI